MTLAQFRAALIRLSIIKFEVRSDARQPVDIELILNVNLDVGVFFENAIGQEQQKGIGER